jgi:NAD(P)-dependent dehydrogenase (short-subunit alcohol dehydrogenase family)
MESILKGKIGLITGASSGIGRSAALVFAREGAVTVLADVDEQGGGAIVNTASVAGLVAERGYSAYAAAKGGVIQLTRTAAVEYAGAKIRINAVCPGAIHTPLFDRSLKASRLSQMMPGTMRPSFMTRIADAMMGTAPVQNFVSTMMQPMGHPGQPEDVAEAAAWLCSDAAAFITGQTLVIDGGMTAA